MLASFCNYTSNNKGTTSWVRGNDRLTNPLVDIANNVWNTFACPLGVGCPTKGKFMYINTICCTVTFNKCLDILDPDNYAKAVINGQKNDVAILSSGQFDQSNFKQLQFKYYRPINGQTIKICFETNNVNNLNVDDMKKCDDAIPPFNWFNFGVWNTAVYRIPNTATKVCKLILKCVYIS